MLTFRKQVTKPKVETERRPWWEGGQVKISHVLKSLQQIYHTPNLYWGSVLKIFIHAVHEGAPSTHWWAGIHVTSPYSKIPSIHAVPMQRPQSEWVILIWRQSEETTTNIVNKNKMILVDFVSVALNSNQKNPETLFWLVCVTTFDMLCLLMGFFYLVLF